MKKGKKCIDGADSLEDLIWKEARRFFHLTSGTHPETNWGVMGGGRMVIVVKAMLDDLGKSHTV